MDFVSAHGGAIPSSAMGVQGQFTHPLVLRDGPAGRLPYLHVRGAVDRPIEARLSRALYYELAEHADADGCIVSGEDRFALGDPA